MSGTKIFIAFFDLANSPSRESWSVFGTSYVVDTTYDAAKKLAEDTLAQAIRKDLELRNDDVTDEMVAKELAEYEFEIQESAIGVPCNVYI